MEINEHNYKDVLLMRLEGELSPEEVLQAEAFILVNEAAAKEWKLLQKTKLQPMESVFFPKKSLLMREEEEVVVAPVFVAEIVADEAPVRKLGGGFNYRKFALPVSIAASLLLFFFFFSNQNTVVENGNNQVAGTENSQPGKENKFILPEQGMASANKQKHSTEAEKNQVQNTGIQGVENQTAKAETRSKKENPAIRKKQNKAFFDENTYAKNAAQDIKNHEPELKLANVELKVPPVENERNNTIKLKKSQAKQLKELAKWQQALEKQQQELATGPGEEMERGIVSRLTHFLNNTVKVKKRTEDDVNYYAFSLETERLKIQKTFKSNF